MDTRTKLLDILTAVLGEDVDESCSAETVEVWDSLTHIEIIVTVEEEFGIKIPQAKISELKSFKNLLEIIANSTYKCSPPVKVSDNGRTVT